jgi:hypothetical protein|eukprot:4977342-Prymnesium_polylepis.1
MACLHLRAKTLLTIVVGVTECAVATLESDDKRYQSAHITDSVGATAPSDSRRFHTMFKVATQEAYVAYSTIFGTFPV